MLQKWKGCIFSDKDERINRRRFVYEIENFNYKTMTYEEYTSLSKEAKGYIIDHCPNEELNDLINRILNDEQKELIYEYIHANEAVERAKEAADKAKEDALKAKEAADKAKEDALKARQQYANKKKKAMRRMKKHIEKTSGNIQY
jgi:hypothetical protein